MSKTAKIIIGVVLVALLGVGTFILGKYMKWWGSSAKSTSKSGAAEIPVPPPGVSIDDFLNTRYTLSPEMAKSPLGFLSAGKPATYVRTFLKNNPQPWMDEEWYNKAGNQGGLSMEDAKVATMAFIMDDHGATEANPDDKGWGHLVTIA